MNCGSPSPLPFFRFSYTPLDIPSTVVSFPVKKTTEPWILVETVPVNKKRNLRNFRKTHQKYAKKYSVHELFCEKEKEKVTPVRKKKLYVPETEKVPVNHHWYCIKSGCFLIIIYLLPGSAIINTWEFSNGKEKVKKEPHLSKKVSSLETEH